MAFAWRDGVHLLGSDLWFDATRAPGLNFVSHGGVRATGARLLASQPTAKVLRALGRRVRPLAPPLGRPVTLGSHRVELLSSGLMPGGAILYVKRRGLRALYAGRIGRNADVRTCDVLCLQVPETEGTPTAIGEAATRAHNETIVLLAPGIAEAYFAAVGMAEGGIAVRAQPQLNSALRALGASSTGYRGKLTRGEALIWPLAQWMESPPAGLADPRTVVLGSRGAPWSEVVSFARATTAKEVVITGNDAHQVAARLADEGLPARPIRTPDQLQLFAEGASA